MKTDIDLNISYKSKKVILSQKIGIVSSLWHSKIVNKMKRNALTVLEEIEFPKENIIEIDVPGSFELIYGSKILYEKHNCNGVITFGCIINGETPHFEYISNSVSNGIAQLNVNLPIPVIFGVLTVNFEKQAVERVNGTHGNKGRDSMLSLLKMMELNLN